MLKVLLLGEHVSPLAGHIQSVYHALPQDTEAHMVTLWSYGANHPSSFFQLGSPAWKRFAFLTRVWKKLYCILALRCNPFIDHSHREYCFYDFDFFPFPARAILKKCPPGFNPDIISIHWRCVFANPGTIRKLHKITGARLVYHFVDESHMTGGCHYPVDCNHYLDECKDCPALKKGKALAHKQYRNKLICLKGIPTYIWGTPYDLRLAKQTELFRNAICLPYIHYPKIKITDKHTARTTLGIDQDQFVVFVAVSHINEVRKGISYTISALKEASVRIPNLLVLFAGQDNLEIPGVDVLHLGYLDSDGLVEAFCASDCFLSTTIADSGPMMVNYSIAAGTPVVSFRMGIAEDLVIHKETGYLADLRNIDDLVEGLLFINGLSATERTTMSQRCIDLIRAKETPELLEQIRQLEGDTYSIQSVNN